MLTAFIVAGVGCAAEPGPPPGEPSEPAPPADPWLIQGEVRDTSNAPLEGIELAVGDRFELSDELGQFAFEVEGGPPVQIDRTESTTAVRSAVTCADFTVLRVWTYGSASTNPTAEVVLTGFEDAAHVTLVWVYENPDYGWVSDYTVSGLQWDTAGKVGATTLLSLPAAARWALLATEVRSDGGLNFARVDGTEPLLTDGSISTRLDLEAVDHGTQPWDGQVPDGVVQAQLRERIEIWGTGIYVPIAVVDTPTPAVDLPVLDGHLGVLEYAVTLTWALPGCDTATSSTTAPPLFPPDTLHLPEFPPPPTVEPDGPWEDRPTLDWTADPDARGNLSVSTYDADYESGPSWSVAVDGGCNAPAVWPERMPTLEPGLFGYLSLYAYGSGWSGSCRSSFQL